MPKLVANLAVIALAADAAAELPSQPRPVPPPAAMLSGPGRNGFGIDPDNGCWVWRREAPTAYWRGACPNGPAEGYGTVEWRGTKTRYVGTMKDGKRDGRGVTTEPNGYNYEGEYRNSARHGRGIQVWGDGARYEGQWANDRPEGYGEYSKPGVAWHGGEWRAGCHRTKDGSFTAIERPASECR